jgi:hypothetical protein
VLALERRRGLRVVADPAALDGARWTGDDVTVLRLAPDEVLALGATSVDLDDTDAIVVAEAGFSAGTVSLDVVLRHLEWSLPSERPALAQGSIAGVPARLWLTEDGTTLVIHAAYAADLQDRLR